VNALPEQADLVVIGAGLMGSAAAWTAARRGLSVLVLEQLVPANDRGSSHGSARIVRRAYPDALYVRMTGRAFELWRELELDSGTTLLRLIGGLDHGSVGDVGEISQLFHDQAIPHEVLPPRAAEERWPGMRFTTPVLFHPQAGTVDAAAAVHTAVGRAVQLGATVAAGTTALSVQAHPDGTATVVSDRGSVRCDRVIAAAGAWLGPLLEDCGLPGPVLTVSQQQAFHFPRQPGVEEWPILVNKGTLSTYSLPGGRDGGLGGGRKVAEHHAQVPGSAPTTAVLRTGVVDDEARRRIVAYVEEWLPGLVPQPFGEVTCLYTSTANEDFVLDKVGPVVICSPCSGHGAKFAPLIGELAVDRAFADQPAIEPRFLLAAHR
jgi:sarcosine oxidase